MPLPFEQSIAQEEQDVVAISLFESGRVCLTIPVKRYSVKLTADESLGI
ncbi:MAG: hypothetical protein MK110_14645 [Fuerstiella sp.]|nr:hypothetical protein [Fuerstiella sp.]